MASPCWTHVKNVFLRLWVDILFTPLNLLLILLYSALCPRRLISITHLDRAPLSSDFRFGFGFGQWEASEKIGEYGDRGQGIHTLVCLPAKWQLDKVLCHGRPQFLVRWSCPAGFPSLVPKGIRGGNSCCALASFRSLHISLLVSLCLAHSIINNPFIKLPLITSFEFSICLLQGPFERLQVWRAACNKEGPQNEHISGVADEDQIKGEAAGGLAVGPLRLHKSARDKIAASIPARPRDLKAVLWKYLSRRNLATSSAPLLQTQGQKWG